MSTNGLNVVGKFIVWKAWRTRCGPNFGSTLLLLSLYLYSVPHPTILLQTGRLPYTPPINRWLAQSKNWLSSNLSINFEPSRSKWADELSKGCHHINDPGSGHIEEFPCWCCQGVYFSIVLWADYLERSMQSDFDWIWFGLPEKWVITIGFLSPVIFYPTFSKENLLNSRV